MTTAAPPANDVSSAQAAHLCRLYRHRRLQAHLTPRRRASRCAGAFLTVLLLLLAHFPAGQQPTAQGAPFSGTSYFVDCADGNDGNSGTSESQAWRGLAKASSAALAPGDALLLKRGCRWSAPLNVPWRGEASRPVTVSAYGSGPAPVIHSATSSVDDVVVTGQYVVVEYLHTTATAPRRESGCQDNPVGQISGVKLKGGAAYNTVRYLTATDLAEGVTIEYGSHHNTITNSLFRNNTMMVKLDPNAFDSYGAHGVNVHGDDNEVANNEFIGHIACSYHHGTDGSAVEIYGGQRNRVHHNVATDNETFVELGDARTADTTFSYNLITSVLHNASFIVTRGVNDYYGPVARSRAYNNTIFLSGANATAIRCSNGCNRDVLIMKNNIVWSEYQVAWTDQEFDDASNIYWRSDGNPIFKLAAIGSTSRKVDPQFVRSPSPAGGSGADFRLRSTSPAIDRGTSESVNAGYTADLDGVAVPQQSAVDIGAYEIGGAVVSPTATPTAVPATSTLINTPVLPTGTPVPPAAPAPAPGEGVPAAPSGANARPRVGNVRLSWNASPTPRVIYNVYRGTRPGQLQLYKSGVTGTRFDDQQVSRGTTYYYQVSAQNEAGESARSNETAAQAR